MGLLCLVGISPSSSFKLCLRYSFLLLSLFVIFSSFLFPGDFRQFVIWCCTKQTDLMWHENKLHTENLNWLFLVCFFHLRDRHPDPSKASG